MGQAKANAFTVVEANDERLVLDIPAGGPQATNLGCLTLCIFIVAGVNSIGMSAAAPKEVALLGKLIIGVFWCIGVGLGLSWFRLRFEHTFLLLDRRRIVVQRVAFGRKSIEEMELGPEAKAEIVISYSPKGNAEPHQISVCGKDGTICDFARALSDDDKIRIVDRINEFLKDRQPISVSGPNPASQDSAAQPMSEPHEDSQQYHPTFKDYAMVGSLMVVAHATLCSIFWFIFYNAIGRQLGWPFNNVFLCAGASTLVIEVSILIGFLRQRRHSRRVAQLCEELGFTWADEVSRKSVPSLPVFTYWSRGSDRMTGERNGVAFQVLDFEAYRSNHQRGNYISFLTIFLCKAGGLPDLTLWSRRLDSTLFGTEGARELKLAPSPSRERDASEAVTQFRKRFRLMSTDHIIQLQSPHDQAVRELFSPSLMSFFNQHSDYSVEVRDGHMAIWRGNRYLRPEERIEFLKTALEIHARLLDNNQSLSRST